VSVEILLIDDLNCPVIRCDECRELIETDTDGVYAWRGGDVSQGSRVYFVHHNASASGYRCHETFERRFPRERIPWDHLREWFRFLDRNCIATDKQGHRKRVSVDPTDGAMP